jgi:hypothetical protein
MSAKKKQEERRKKLHFEASKDVLSIAWRTAPVEVDYSDSITLTKSMSFEVPDTA